eukprot:scaffold82841_cov63-Cyclotella_meneghiniana.AAC.5
MQCKIKSAAAVPGSPPFTSKRKEQDQIGCSGSRFHAVHLKTVRARSNWLQQFQVPRRSPQNGKSKIKSAAAVPGSPPFTSKR